MFAVSLSSQWPYQTSLNFTKDLLVLSGSD